jgi:hypothetical protein
VIDEDALRKAYAELRGRVEYLERALGLFASDIDLDGKGGDPVVKFSPRAWRGADHTGRHFSACDPTFLEMLAETLSWMADNPTAGKERYAKYNRSDARLARSWSRRLRGGWAPPGGSTADERVRNLGGRDRAPAPERGVGRPPPAQRQVATREISERHAAPPDDFGPDAQDDDDFLA